MPRRPPIPPSKPTIPTPPPECETPPLQQALPWRPQGLSDDGDRILELRLFYEYTKSTSNTASLQAITPVLANSIWEFDIPQIAFSSDIVLNALFAITALHLQGVSPDDPVLARASLSYLDKAVTKHQVALARVDEQSAESLLVAAILIAHYTWLVAHSKRPEERYAITLQTFHMCNGIKALVQRFKPCLDKYEWPDMTLKPIPIEFVAKKAFMRNAAQDLDLLSSAFDKVDMPLEQRSVYNAAKKKLMGMYSFVASDADITYIEQVAITYLHTIPLEFVSLLEREDPIAMALLARDLSMLSMADESPAWWIHGTGINKVVTKAVLGIQKLMPPEWQWTMDWPVKVVNKEIDFCSDCAKGKVQECCK
jgi:hypothetical protein